jgi:Protein of unknown function (DUF2971)
MAAARARGARANVRSPDEFGVFCLTELPDSEKMWAEYADNGTGFVIAFDTTHPSFSRLKTPGRLGKVKYSDEPLGTFLGMMAQHGAGFFFRKRMRYALEAEWRSIRALHRLEGQPGEIFLAPFQPSCVRGIVIRSECSVKARLRQLIEGDARHRHATIIVQGPRST